MSRAANTCVLRKISRSWPQTAHRQILRVNSREFSILTTHLRMVLVCNKKKKKKKKNLETKWLFLIDVYISPYKYSSISTWIYSPGYQSSKAKAYPGCDNDQAKTNLYVLAPFRSKLGRFSRLQCLSNVHRPDRRSASSCRISIAAYRSRYWWIPAVIYVFIFHAKILLLEEIFHHVIHSRGSSLGFIFYYRWRRRRCSDVSKELQALYEIWKFILLLVNLRLVLRHSHYLTAVD